MDPPGQVSGSLKFVQGWDQVGHCNVCKPMTKLDTLMWDPPIPNLATKWVITVIKALDKGSHCHVIESNLRFSAFKSAFKSIFQGCLLKWFNVYLRFPAKI